MEREAPNRYDALLTVVSDAGVVLAQCAQPVGFRRFELRDGLMLLNGRRIVFNGVNRHEWSATNGRAITIDEIEHDFRLLKLNNFNAVRTSHYPNQTKFYQLCDQYGLYVIDETNLETHGTWMLKSMGLPCKNILPDDRPEWRGAVLDRGKSMLERDKNHPCILIWSCGNESYGGKTLYELSQYFRTRDPRRLVHYEGIFHDRRYPETSDMESRMYEKPAAIAAYLRSRPKKPFLLCEYAHAMGNSFGNVDENTALARQYPQYQGGFIWDWIDQGLCFDAAKDRGDACSPPRSDAAHTFFAVGGDFCDRPNDRYFCGDGLLFADRTPTPKLAEAKFLYAPVRIVCSETGIAIENLRAFTDTDDMIFRWTLTNDGEPVANGEFTLRIPAGETRAHSLTLTLDRFSGERVLTCAAHYRNDTLYAPAGHEITFGQAMLRPATASGKQSPHAAIIRGLANIGVQMAHSRVMIDRRTGLIVSAVRNGVEFVKFPILPDFWRAPTDNDIGSSAPLRWAKWKTASLYRVCSTAFVSENRCRVRAWYYGGVFYRLDYTFYENDTFDMTLRLFPTPGDAPHAGFALTLPPTLHHMAWFGNSACEAASDRRNARRIELCHGDAAEQYVPYLNPQDCANKTDLRWLSVTDDAGNGIQLSAKPPFTASVLPWTSHELELAANGGALPPATKTVISAAAEKCGVGGDDSWGARVHKQYRVPTGRGVRFTLRIRLLARDDD